MIPEVVENAGPEVLAVAGGVVVVAVGELECPAVVVVVLVVDVDAMEDIVVGFAVVLVVAVVVVVVVVVGVVDAEVVVVDAVVGFEVILVVVLVVVELLADAAAEQQNCQHTHLQMGLKSTWISHTKVLAIVVGNSIAYQADILEFASLACISDEREGGGWCWTVSIKQVVLESTIKCRTV